VGDLDLTGLDGLFGGKSAAALLEGLDRERERNGGK